MDAGRRLTWTLLWIAIIALLVIRIAHAKPLDAYDGTDWAEWSYEYRVNFVHGLVLGAYSVTYGLQMFHDSFAIENAARFIPYDESIDEIIQAINVFYARYPTTLPLWVAFLNRNGRVKEEIYGNRH